MPVNNRGIIAVTVHVIDRGTHRKWVLPHKDIGSAFAQLDLIKQEGFTFYDRDLNITFWFPSHTIASVEVLTEGC